MSQPAANSLNKDDTRVIRFDNPYANGMPNATIQILLAILFSMGFGTHGVK